MGTRELEIDFVRANNHSPFRVSPKARPQSSKSSSADTVRQGFFEFLAMDMA